MLKLSKNLILASNSPRRKELLTQAGFAYTVHSLDTDEGFSASMPSHEVAGYLAHKKAAAFGNQYPNSLLLTADTIVVIGQQILNKPAHAAEAKAMLRGLSGRQHTVYTGVCLKYGQQYTVITDSTLVTFKELTDQEIDYYIHNCQPFDKAGAYGVQDFIGMIGINSIQGSFFTVMGLPIHRVYELLQPYILF
jgi:septum formation protein